MAAWTVLSSCASPGTTRNGALSDAGAEELREECAAGGMTELDAETALLEERAKEKPELYIDVAERLYRKAEMYRLQVEELERMRERDHREEWKVMRARDKALEEALAALEKVPGKVYPDTDVRLLKALVFVALEKVQEAIEQLEELLRDTQADPALRIQAGKLHGELIKGR
jgi:tetratricopeptide (TPR) repeat protein